MQHLKVSGAVRHIYIYVVRQLRAKDKISLSAETEVYITLRVIGFNLLPNQLASP